MATASAFDCSSVTQAQSKPWWTLFLRKSQRLFFDNSRLAMPAVVWLALSLLLPHSVGPVWRGAFLSCGFCAILVLGTVASVAQNLR